MTEKTTTTPPPADHFLVRSTSWPGYWGRGPSIDAAVKAAQWMNPGDKVHLIQVDANAYCDDFGDLQHNNRIRLGVGTLARDRKGVWRVDKLDASKV